MEDKINEVNEQDTTYDNNDTTDTESEANNIATFSGFSSLTIDNNETTNDDLESTKMTKKKKKRGFVGPIIFVSIVVIISVFLAFSIISISGEIMGFNKGSEAIQITIPKGSSNQQIAAILKEKGIIKYPTVFRFIAKSEEDVFNYGLYTLYPGMSYSEIFKQLQEKTEIEGQFDFTIVEGDTLYTIAKKLEKKGICTVEGFAKIANSASFGFKFEQYITNAPLKFNRIEGYLYPDTYKLYKGMDTEEILKVVFGNLNNKISDSMYARMEEMNMTLEQTLTLASIIQAEAGNTEDMKKISGVFHNRLNNSSSFPRLESDPTRKYVELNIKPYSEKNNPDMNYAYNTYEGKGLPPGPICNPGLDAINAALYPEASDYYYFCSNIDTKECFYAKTKSEHESNLVKAGLR